MDFSLTYEQEQLRDSVRKLLERQSPLPKSGAATDITELPGLDVWPALVDMGLLQLGLDFEDTGIEDDLVSLIVVLEELGRKRVAEPYLSTVLAARLFATLELSESGYLEKFVSGNIRASVAMYEAGSGYSYETPVLQAAVSRHGYVLNGRKVAVRHCGSGGKYIVSARLSEESRRVDSQALFVVDGDANGVQSCSYPTIDGGHGCSLLFQDCMLGSEALLCRGERAETLLRGHVETAILLLGAEALGLMQYLLNETVEFCNQRIQFGQPIGKFQSLQHRLADMYIACESIRSLLYAAVMHYCVASPDTGQAIAALKYKVGQLGRSAAEVAVQLHGAIGFIEDSPVGGHYKRLVVIDALFGNSDHHLQSYIDAR